MKEVSRLAEAGLPVIGICNGFQILCEAGLLPGALIANHDLRFICRPVHLRVESTDSVLTRSSAVGDVLRIPLNSYEGNYLAPEATLDELESAGGVILRYATGAGELLPEANPNGSTNAIAGIVNPMGNVAGLMPHPERAVEPVLGSEDGLVLLESFVASLTPARAAT
jgi:phosphoribosylformylglycinamidine synthase